METFLVSTPLKLGVFMLNGIILPSTNVADFIYIKLRQGLVPTAWAGKQLSCFGHCAFQYLIPVFGRNIVLGAPSAVRTANVFVVGL